jgi:hypothetical protein
MVFHGPVIGLPAPRLEGNPVPATQGADSPSDSKTPDTASRHTSGGAVSTRFVWNRCAACYWQVPALQVWPSPSQRSPQVLPGTHCLSQATWPVGQTRGAHWPCRQLSLPGQTFLQDPQL